MGFFGDLLRVAAPVVGGIVGGPAGAAIGAGISGWIGSRQQGREQQQAASQAGQTAMGGFNYLAGSPVGQQYLPAGGAAIQQQQALLGLGGDPAAAEEAYRRYQESTGFQGQLRTGEQAITGSAAARGMLGSGSTLRGLARYGQQLGAQSFNNYLGQLSGVAGMGLQAGGALGNAAMQGHSQAASYQYGGATAGADARASGWDQLMGGLGTAYDAWQNRTRTPPKPAAALAPVPTRFQFPTVRTVRPVLAR